MSCIRLYTAASRTAHWIIRTLFVDLTVEKQKVFLVFRCFERESLDQSESIMFSSFGQKLLCFTIRITNV